MKKAKFTKPLTVSLPPEVFSRIKAITDEKEIGMAEWVRDAIHAMIEANPEGNSDLLNLEKGAKLSNASHIQNDSCQ